MLTKLCTLWQLYLTVSKCSMRRRFFRKVIKLMAIITGISLGYNSVSSTLFKIDRNKPEKEYRNRQTKNANETKYVLIYSYMRGGTSFFGEVFNMNKDAFYFYEPMDPLVAQTFGIGNFIYPLDYLYISNKVMKLREMDEEEVKAMTNHINAVHKICTSVLQ